MIWGAIRSDGARVIRLCEDRQDGDAYSMYSSILYIKILESTKAFFHSGRATSRHGIIFQQDGASCHSCLKSKKWFNDNNVDVLDDWPAQSPDLNIIQGKKTTVEHTINKKK